MGPLTALDIVVLLLVIGGAGFGLMRGFVSEVLSLVAWVGVVVALKFLHTPVAAWLVGPVGTRPGAAVLAFALIAGVVFFGGKLLAGSIGARTRQSIIGPLDRGLGFGFGALKGLIGATLLFLLANLGVDLVYGAAAQRPGWIATSRTLPLLTATSRAVVDFVAWRRRAGGPGAETGSRAGASGA
jgi:membrane protein required for colicin V production